MDQALLLRPHTLRLFDDELKETTVLSIGHRPDLAVDHTRTLQLVHGRYGDRLKLKPAPRAVLGAALAATARRLITDADIRS